VLYLFVGFQKHVAEMRHQFLMFFSHFFSLDTILMNKQKVPMDARRCVPLPSIDSPSTTLTTNFAT
jgi:hypothetical protein